eukprot:jgi/Botrbrau1/20821/Bobra.0156s0048.1
MENVAEKYKEQRKLGHLLVLASSRGYIGDVKELLDRGADLQATDKRKIGALHYACGQGRLEVVKFLRSKGVELDVEDPSGRTPLHWAVLGGSAEVVAYLLSKGAWSEGNDANDDTPLHLAARKGKLEIVELLVKGGAKATVNEVNKRGLSPLGEAISQGHSKIAEFLIRQGADVHTLAHQWTMLHIAAGLGQAMMIPTLVSAGLDVNDQDNIEEVSPLHAAALGGSWPSAQALLKANADKGLLDSAQRTAFNRAPKGAEWKPLFAPQAKAARPAAKPKDPGPVSEADKFKALSQEEKLARAAGWVGLEPGAKLDKVAADFGPSVREAILEAQKAQQFYRITQAITELHDDDDFQRLAVRPGMQDIINELRQSGDAVVKYQSDADIMEVLSKLRRFQMIVRANGRHQIPFEMLLVGKEVDWKALDVARLTAMKHKVDSSMADIVKRVTGDGATQTARQQESTPTETGHSEISALAPPANVAPIESGETGQQLEDKPFSWKDFGKAMLLQGLRSTLMGLFFVIGMWLMGQPMPWQNHPSSQDGLKVTPERERQEL